MSPLASASAAGLACEYAVRSTVTIVSLVIAQICPDTHTDAIGEIPLLRIRSPQAVVSQLHLPVFPISLRSVVLEELIHSARQTRIGKVRIINRDQHDLLRLQVFQPGADIGRILILPASENKTIPGPRLPYQGHNEAGSASLIVEIGPSLGRVSSDDQVPIGVFPAQSLQEIKQMTKFGEKPL